MPFNLRISGPKKSPELNRPFATELGFLMESRKLKGIDLAKLVNASKVTVSKWRQSKTTPRESKFKQLVEVLCVTNEEKERFKRAYYYPYSCDYALEQVPRAKAQQIEHMKAKIEMANRAKPAKHKRKVRDEIEEAGIPYKQDYLVGDIVIDFLLVVHSEEYDIELEIFVPVERQIALLCETDTNSEYDRSMAYYLTINLWVDGVFLILPKTKECRHEYVSLEQRKKEAIEIKEAIKKIQEEKIPQDEKQKKSNAHMISKTKTYNQILEPEGLKLYLAELKASSVPPPVTISREEQAFPEQVKLRLTSLKIRLDKKDGVDCVVKRKEGRIPLQYNYDLRGGLHEAAEDALRLKNQLKTSEVVVIIPDSHGYGSITMLLKL